MNTEVAAVKPTATVQEAAQIMYNRDIGSVIVVHNGSVKGVFTEHDCMYTIAEDIARDTAVREVMTTNLVTVSPDETLEEAAEKLSSRHIHHLPVLEDGELVGVLTVKDVLLYEKELFDTVSELFFSSRTRNHFAS